MGVLGLLRVGGGFDISGGGFLAGVGWGLVFILLSGLVGLGFRCGLSFVLRVRFGFVVICCFWICRFPVGILCFGCSVVVLLECGFELVLFCGVVRTSVWVGFGGLLRSG